MSKNLNFELKKEENYVCDLSKREVEGLSGALECGLYGGEAHGQHKLC
jgi:hypothetical protein